MRRAVLVLAGGCVSPAVDAPREPTPAVCAQTTLPIAGIAQLEVAATPLGASMIWIGAGGVMTQRLDANASPVGAPVAAWAGTYERATVAAIGDQVVVGAVAADVTWMVSAPLGLPPFRELAILGGVVGESPIVVAGDQRLAASVSYGGMQVNAFDAGWHPATSLQAVLTTDAREVAVAPTGSEAVVVWPTAASCYVARIYDAVRGESWPDPGTCPSPRLAATESDVGLAFERDGGVYVARATASELAPHLATRIGDGRAPRIVAFGDRYWVSYIEATGALVAGFDDKLIALAGPIDSNELAVVGGVPRVFAAGAAGLTVTSLCAE